MSGGRPSTPAQWAVTADFPGSPTSAAPWQGQPLKLYPTSGYFIPGTGSPPAAEELNFMFYQTSTDVYNLSLQSGTPDGQTWLTGQLQWSNVTAGGGTFTSLLNAPVYNAGSGLWYIWATIDISSTPTKCFFQSSDGITWAEVSSSSRTVFTGPVITASRASDGAVLTNQVSVGPTNDLVVTYPVTGASSVFSTTTLLQNPGSDCWSSGAYFDGRWVVWSGGQGGAPSYTNTDGGTWVASTWSPPSSFVIHNAAHIVAPALLLLFPSGTSVVSEYMSSADGITFSQQTMPTLVSGESVIDATYDSVTGTYYLFTGTSSACRVWASTSGAGSTWSVVSPTIGSTTFFMDHQGFALKANGTELVALVNYAGLTRAIMSTTGGASWVILPFSDATAPGNYFSFKANGSQFIYSNTATYSASGVAGYALPAFAI